MKKYLYVFLLSSFLSISAQNIVLNGKFSKPFNKNYEKAYTLEALIATNNNVFSVGILFGFADIHFNTDGYNWVYSKHNDMTKGIIGVITYIYPLSQTNFNILKPIYLSLSWSGINDSGYGGAGMVFYETGYIFPDSQSDNILTFSSGYKIDVKVINILFSVGYQYRKYDLRFDEYNEGNFRNTYLIPQIEKSVQLDIGLQYVF